MLELIEQIRARIADGAYVNEAAISHGVVTPILNALGWDSADPKQLVPEYSAGRGRVDFALFGLGKGPAVFIEVKGIGRAMDGDRQLFEYAFHQGVPLCVLTDGREWSFYLPGGQGSYEERRLYRLQLDDRAPEECVRVFERYLQRERVRDRSAFADALNDHRDDAGLREARAALPKAWQALLGERHELILETLAEKAEAISGYAPAEKDILKFLNSLRSEHTQLAPTLGRTPDTKLTARLDASTAQKNSQVEFTFRGRSYACANAAQALVEILRLITAEDPSKIEALAELAKGPKRNLIARTAQEINPKRPDLSRGEEFATGWLVGLNISNQEKLTLIREACSVYSVSMPPELEVTLPNAK